MAKSTKNTYKPTKKGNLIPVVRMADGGNVSELNYSDRKAYIESHYAPFITDAQMIFSIYDSGIEYDYKGDRKEVVNSIIESYKSLADYTEITLPQETIYEIKDWELVRKDIDPDTDDVIGEKPLKELSADNTYNFSYNGLVDLNWRVYEDEEYERYFYVITPHLGGDIRGNYGDAFILQGNDKDELFYRYYEGFISGGASIYFKFKDGSEIGFDSEQDSDVFYFRLNEIFEPTGMAKKYLKDFEKFETWYGDEFLEESIDIYLMRKGEAPKMMAGGSLNDETPMAYIQVLGYNEGQWFNLTDYSDGQDVIDGIYDWMNGLNTQFGGNREEYEVTDYEGFGNDLYDQYMSSNEFDEIIEGYEKYENSDFHSDIITAYRNDSGSGSNSLSDVIDEMDNNFFGKYESLQDFGYEMVQQGVYEPSDYDVYITDTDKRILAGEEADAVVDGMDFDELLNIAEGVKSEYESEISDLENKISDITTEIDELTSLQDDIENADDEEYEIISDQIEEKEVELDDIQNELDNIDSSFEDRAREEARDTFYDEIYDKLENDLSSWLEEYGYTENLQDISFLSVDYEKIGDEIGADYLIIEYDGQMYFFSNYAKGGRLMATKQKPKYDYYIVESSTKKLVSGYSTKKEALEQRKLLIEEYPSMRFEIYTLGNLESKTDLDVFSKKDYVQLSTLDKIKKVSVDAFRYGKEKVGQANEFLVRNDVKGKIKRGARNVADKTKQGFNWLRNKWNEADFGDGKGRAKFFADGGEVNEYYVIKNENGWVLGYRGSSSEIYFSPHTMPITFPSEKTAEEFIDRNRIKNPVVQKGIIVKLFADGGILGEIYGKKDGGNKIDIYYKTSKGEHHYLNSTNSSKTIREAVEKYKKILEGDSQTSFAERKRINGLEGKFADGGNLYSHQIGKYVRAYYNETISNDDNGYQVNLMFYNNQDDDDYFDEEFITTNSPEEAEILADKINEEGVEKFMPKNKFADGGMAGLGEVSGMLPNALPMSTITPMADGGKLADWKEGKFINGKKWYLYKYDNKRWVLEIYKKDDLIDSYYIDVEELENQETGIGKKIYISYSNSQGSGILIPEMVQVKVFNVIKMDNPKLYFGENVYDYQVAHNKFSEEFGYSNGGGDGGGVDDVWIALSKTKNGLLLSERFDKQITHKQLFDYYKKRGYEIIDGNIFKVTNKGVLDIFKDAISKFIKQKYNELVDWENTLLSYEIVGDRIIAQSCFVQTKNGNEYKITPNDLVNKKFDDGGVAENEIKVGDKVIWRGNEYFFGKISNNSVDGMIDEKYHLTSYKKNVSNAILDSLKEVKKMADGGGVSTPKYYLTLKKGLTITNELYQDTFKTGIQYSDWGITAEQYKKLKNGDTINIKGSNVSWDWQFKVTKDMVERIREIKTNDVEFANGGRIENAEMPTRERTTITKPTTTPTTTPSKPDKDNPYNPKIKPRPKASKYNLN